MQRDGPQVLCRRCSYVNLPNSRICAGCGIAFLGYSPIERPLDESATRSPSWASDANAIATSKPYNPGSIKTVLGVVGSLVLVLGVFAPLISVPVVGTLNYFQNGKGDGVIVLALASISLVLSMAGKHRGLWFTGLACAAILAFTFINFQIRLNDMKSQMAKELANNPFRGLADVATEAIQMQWGWAILIIGIFLLLLAAYLKPQRLR